MEFLLIRHAEPDWVPGGFGVDDPGLTERGGEEAAALAAALAAEFGTQARAGRVDALWVSPARRSRATAGPVGEALGLEARVLDWLMEASTPSWEGQPAADVLSVLRSVRGRSAEQWWDGFDGAETQRDFVARVGGGLDAELGRLGATRNGSDGMGLWRAVPRAGRVAIVSHAGTTGALIAHLLGLAQVPWSWERFAVGHASITRVKSVPMTSDAIFSLRRMGDLSHLSDASGLGFIGAQD